MRQIKEVASGSFEILPAQHGTLLDLSHDDRRFRIAHWGNDRLRLDDQGSHFGFVRSGAAHLQCEAGEFPIRAGMYFCVPGRVELSVGGTGFIVTQNSWRGFFHLGGPVEPEGRLRYIDGCSDSLLIPPLVSGDACLNLLHIPMRTHQTQHTHPSFRVGMVVSGAGTCRTADGESAMEPGAVFVIRRNGLHSFHTQDRPLKVIAFHPDSDSGPSHDCHPMLNRTFVDGSSAADLRRSNQGM